MRNLINIDIETPLNNTVCNVSENCNTTELTIDISESWGNSITLNFTLPDSQTATTTLTKSNNQVTYTVPSNYYNIDGTLILSITDGTNTSSNISFTTISFINTDDVCCKSSGTNTFSYNKCVIIPDPRVIDNLTSTSTTDALSANQGKILNDTKADNSRFTADCINDVDANDYTLSGMYYLGTGCANMPFGDSYVRIIVNGNGGNDISQIGVGVSSKRKYTRIKYSGTWGAWQEDIQWLGAISIDLNSVASNCDFYTGSRTTNRPTGVSNGYVSVRAYNSSYISQTYEPFDTPSVFYKRKKISGTWSAWLAYNSV